MFRGNTKIITTEGPKELKDLDGKKVKLLSQSKWRDAEVKNFGKQELRLVKLTKGNNEKYFHVTPDHIWIVDRGWGNTELIITDKLKEGDMLPNDSLDKLMAMASGWRVVSVKKSKVDEVVYSAVVPTTHTFALDGGILTHN